MQKLVATVPTLAMPPSACKPVFANLFLQTCFCISECKGVIDVSVMHATRMNKTTQLSAQLCYDENPSRSLSH